MCISLYCLSLNPTWQHSVGTPSAFRVELYWMWNCFEKAKGNKEACVFLSVAESSVKLQVLHAWGKFIALEDYCSAEEAAVGSRCWSTRVLGAVDCLLFIEVTSRHPTQFCSYSKTGRRSWIPSLWYVNTWTSLPWDLHSNKALVYKCKHAVFLEALLERTLLSGYQRFKLWFCATDEVAVPTWDESMLTNAGVAF